MSGQTPLLPKQFGLRSNHSTESTITLLWEKVENNLEKNKYVGAAFLDLRKAWTSNCVFMKRWSTQEAPIQSALTNIQNRVASFCLQLNTQKRVSVLFKNNNKKNNSHIQECCQTPHSTIISKIIQYNVCSFNPIRRLLTDQAALMFLHYMNSFLM